MEDLRGIYVISVAARLLNMHPQTLRKYERFGLVNPTRTLGIRRLYSNEDIARLKAIKFLVDEIGLNLAGVELALQLVGDLLLLQEEISEENGSKTLRLLVQHKITKMLHSLGAV